MEGKRDKKEGGREELNREGEMDSKGKKGEIGRV